MGDVSSLERVLELARQHVHLCPNYSAQVCLADAERLRDVGQYAYALERAMASLKHSVGILSSVYQRANQM